ncbi:hypothetical protein EVAR_32597_1 [Eumeta japonica]|uniref:Uncharacterized protein n=1 Tax=Eumeta variegata TaxID=151549 RepID=A0A4C1WIM3_EUMVA|nr:hypothetical protein EVAR_32597_1 [Eumeta japonica]
MSKVCVLRFENFNFVNIRKVRADRASSLGSYLVDILGHAPSPHGDRRDASARRRVGRTLIKLSHQYRKRKQHEILILYLFCVNGFALSNRSKPKEKNLLIGSPRDDGRAKEKNIPPLNTCESMSR